MLPRLQRLEEVRDGLWLPAYRQDRHSTGKRPEIPMHPTLRLVLDAWRTGGFARFHRRHPRADDYLVPSVADVREYR